MSMSLDIEIENARIKMEWSEKCIFESREGSFQQVYV